MSKLKPKVIEYDHANFLALYKKRYGGISEEPSLDELNKRNAKQVKTQLEGQKILDNTKDAWMTPEQRVGVAIVDAVAEPFKTIAKGLSQLGTGVEILDPNKSIIEKTLNATTNPKANPIAGAINLATGIAEIPMLIGTVPLETIGAGLKEVGLGAVSEGVNEVFKTIAEAPSSVAQEITDALEKHGAATQIRNFIDQKTVEYGISNAPLRIDPTTGQEIKEATNQATGLAAIVGLGALAHGAYKGLKENVQAQSALKELGYSKEDVLKMKPEEAQNILKEYADKRNIELTQKQEVLRNNIENEVTQKNIIPEAEKQTSDLPSLEQASTKIDVQETTKLSLPGLEEVKSSVTEKPITEQKSLEPTEELKPTQQIEQSIPKEPTKISDIPPDKVVNEKLIDSKEAPEDIAITKQKMNDLRERVGLPELDKTVRQSIPETFDNVKSEIESGIRNEETLLSSIESGKRELDSTQSFELAYYLTKETNKWNTTFDKIKEAQKSGDVETEALLRGLADESLGKIKKISDIASSVTSEWGRFGRFMQVQLAQDYSIARTMQRAELYAPKGEIPLETKSKLETLSSDITKLQEAFQKYKTNQPTKTVDDFIAKAQRDYEFEQRKTKRAVTKDELRLERTQLWNDLYKQTNVAAAGVPLTPEAIRTMGRLATNYVRDGIITAEGLVEEFYKGFQEKVPKDEIMKALSGYGKQSTMTRDEVVTKYNVAKKEMKLLLAIEDAQKGIEPSKQTRTPSQPNQRIQNLQKLLKSVTKKNIDVSDATKLQTQKTRVQNNIAEYESQLKEGRFEKKTRKPIIPDKELVELKTKEHQLKKQVELELYKLKRMGATNWEKTKEIAVDVANIPRTLLATADLSMPLRQGLPLGSAYPKFAAQAFAEMHKASVSGEYFKNRMTQIETSPNARVYEKMGVDFTGVGSDLVQLAKREESFIAAHILNKVPGLKQITQFSERGAVAYLNVLRQNIADWQIKLMMEKGMTPENSLKAYQDVGKLINWGTGRSDLGWMERAPGVLNAVMFSPRNFVAKFHLMNPLEYVKLEPQARKLMMREQLATLAQGIMFLNLMKLNGANVETDPRSSDFAKARIGNTRIDMFGGFQQNAVFLTRLVYGIMGKPAVKTTTGKLYKLNGKQFPFSTPLDLTGRFFRGKASPQATIVIDALAGRDMMGNEFGKDVEKEVLNRFIPMVWQDALDAQKELGWGALGTALMGFYGAGTQTFQPRPSKIKSKYGFNK